MKTIYTTTLALLFGAYSFAQQPMGTTPVKPDKETILTKFMKVNQQAAAKKAIKAASFQNSIVQLFDSVYVFEDDTATQTWNLITRINSIVYNSNNIPTSDITQNKVGNTWQNFMKNKYTYNSNGDMISDTTQYWANNAWHDSTRVIYTFDANFNQTGILQQFNSAGNWTNGTNETYSYNANNISTGYIYYSNWNGLSYNDIYSYAVNLDSHNNAVTFTNTQSSGGLVYTSFGTYHNTYDINNNLIGVVTHSGNNPADSSNVTYTYDANHNMLIKIEQSPDTATNTWVNTSKVAYTYNSNNQILTQIFQSWDSSTSAWSLWFYQENYTYDTNGNQTSLTSQFWDGSAFQNTSQVLNNYDANNFMLDDIRYYFNNGIVSGGQKVIYYYHTIVSTIKSNTIFGEFSISPNPATTQFTINYNQEQKNTILTITNLVGKEVATYKMDNTNNKAIDISNLSDGVYFVNLKSDDKIITKKFIKTIKE